MPALRAQGLAALGCPWKAVLPSRFRLYRCPLLSDPLSSHKLLRCDPAHGSRSPSSATWASGFNCCLRTPGSRTCHVAAAQPADYHASPAPPTAEGDCSGELGRASFSPLEETRAPRHVLGALAVGEAAVEEGSGPPVAPVEPAESTRGRRQGQRARSQAAGKFPVKGREYELVCESLAFKGLGVCKIEGTGLVVLCERALPGERLIGRVHSIKKNSFAQAFKVRTLAPHANAVEAPCPHFPACGGCRLQNLSYGGQLAAKAQQVADLVARVGRFGPSAEGGGSSGAYMRPIVACEQEYHYRNKMEFSFGSRVWIPAGDGTSSPIPAGQDPDVQGGGRASPNPRQWALGLHAPRRFDKVLPISACLLQDPVANEVLRTVREHCEARREEVPPYDVVSHEGYLRHLTIRKGRDLATGGLQLMVNISTKLDRPEALEPLARELVRQHPQVVSVINSVNPSLGDASPPVREHVLHGEETITATLRGLTFRISSSSFFQTNTEQAEVLYGLVESACQLKGDGSEVVLDLFCGTGTIGLSLASKVRHVYGFELVPEAVADARSNAERNGVRNTTFVQGDLNKLAADFGHGFPRPDVIITDPNRPGMHPKLLQFLLASGTPRIVYVSCNPATCARDLDALCHTEDGGPGVYRLVSIQPVDMFPQTPHVECVSILELAGGSAAGAC